MKRTISLIIAIAVMISMFVLPASAAEYIVDMSTLNGASAFTVAANIPIPGITLSDIGLHFQTGEPGATNGNTVDIPLDLSGYNTMVITYRNGAAVGDECADLQLQKADYTATIGTFDLKGTGSWGTTAEASLDISAVTEGETNYRLTLQSGANGSFVTGIKLTTDTTSGGGSVTPPPAGDTVTSLSGIVEGNNVLGADISGTKSFSSGTYVIDLAGYKWTGNMLISGTADVTIMDSSAEKTGVVDAFSMGDAIDVSGGKLTLNGVKVIGSFGSGDALFVSGGTVVSNDSILTAGKAGIDVTSTSASVTVNGGTFATFPANPPEQPQDERNCAVELRWNASVTFNGNITFDVNRIICRATQDGNACHTNAIANSVVCGDNASATFTDEASFTANSNYKYADMTYTYTTAAGDPAFVDGAAISLTGGLTINFLAENITANEYVMVGDVRVDAEYKTAGEYAGYYVFAFGDFGPQEMGDDFTAELYSNGVVVDSMTYSVADYCYAVIEDSSSSATLVKLAKATLNYGAAAQKYRNYKVNNLVNANLSDDDQNPWYAPWAAEPTVGNDSSVHAQYLWHRANVHFADKLSLVVTFKADYAVEVTDAPDHVVCIWDINDRSQDQILDVTDLGNGEYQVTVTDILPTQYQLYFCFYVVAESGEQLTDELNFSISSYIELNDYYLEGENEDYGYYEPIGPINDLVRALSQYGDAAAAYVA